MITRLLDGLRKRPGRGRTPAASPTSGELTVSVTYAPEADGAADPGEVVWTWVAYEDDPTQGKDRPVVVLGWWGEQFAAVALTSKGSDGDEDRVPVGTGAWDPQRRPSFAKVDRVLSVDPRRVRREGSTFDRRQFERLVEEVRRRHPDLDFSVPDGPGTRTRP